MVCHERKNKMKHIIGYFKINSVPFKILQSISFMRIAFKYFLIKLFFIKIKYWLLENKYIPTYIRVYIRDIHYEYGYGICLKYSVDE